MKIKKIFSRDIAIKLMARNNDLLFTEANRQKYWLKVFCFQETDKLMNDLTELTGK